MKKIVLVLLSVLMIMGITACDGQKSELNRAVYEAVSKQTMSRLLIFVDKDQMEECYKWQEDLSYYQLIEGQEEVAKELFQKPTLWIYEISQPGFGQRIGLTECEEVFSMIRTDEKLLERAVTLASKEADINQISKIIWEEYITLGLVEGGE